MAWRIDEQVVRGEIDNRERGRMRGRIWLVGHDAAVELDLEGNPWRDLAGHVLRFSNPRPRPGSVGSFARRQSGVVGDITASRKVKVPDVPVDGLERLDAAGEEVPWHWGNGFHLEWFSRSNGRVVIEATGFELELDGDPAWTMSADEESEQQLANARALTRFIEDGAASMGEDPANPVNPEDVAEGGDGTDDDDDAPQSAAEAQADAEAARMDLLLDRVTARLEREGLDGLDEDKFDEIYLEERERLRRERGEPEEKPLTAEEQARQDAWIEELNAAADEALEEMEADEWKGTARDRRHPLVERGSALAVRAHNEIRDGGWMPDDAQHEHPLVEVINGTMAASAKLAGALGMQDDEEWPPDEIIAGNTLVRLKKARDHLRDALRGLDAAEDEQLAPLGWCAGIRREAAEMLGIVQQLIREVREVLADSGEGA